MLKPFGKSLSQHMQGVELAVPSGQIPKVCRIFFTFDFDVNLTAADCPAP